MKTSSTHKHTRNQSNVWLRSCEKEIETPLEGETSGTIPDWLSGCLIRNGPGSIKVGNEEFQHLFDCPSLLHRFAIASGKVTYQCKFLRSNTYKKNTAANRIVVTEFGTKTVPDPCHSIFRRIATIFTQEVTDNANVSVYPFNDELYALTETPLIHRVDVETLDTIHRVDLTKHYSVVCHTSHPHITPDGTVYNLGLAVYLTGPHYIIVKFANGEDNSKSMFENAEIVASIPTRWSLHPSYMHTFGMTENYYLIVEQPFSLSVAKGICAKLKNDPIATCFKWFEKEFTQISVISRKTGTLIHKFVTAPFCYFHIINQYEKDDYIVIDICTYKDASIVNFMYIESIRNGLTDKNCANATRTRPMRFILPLKSYNCDQENNFVTSKCGIAKGYRLSENKILVTPEKLCDVGCELPVINYKQCFMKPYKYFYAIGIDFDSDELGSLIKVDVVNGTTKIWHEPDCHLGEPIFVPKPIPESEDDGVILSTMFWTSDESKMGLIVLNAVTFEEIGRTVFKTSSSVPRDFHGWFLPSK